MQCDDDLVAVFGQMFVDAVIDDFPQQMMQAARVGPADIHRRPLANMFEPFEDFDIFGCIA